MQIPEPEFRDDVCAGVAWLTYHWQPLRRWSGMNIIEMIDAFSYLQARGFVETDLRPSQVDEHQLILNDLQAVRVRLSDAIAEAAA
jgi:hypothetical protein